MLRSTGLRSQCALPQQRNCRLASPAPTEAIRVRDLSKRFGETVTLDRLSLSALGGGFFGLLSPNGGGVSLSLPPRPQGALRHPSRLR